MESIVVPIYKIFYYFLFCLNLLGIRINNSMG